MSCHTGVPLGSAASLSHPIKFPSRGASRCQVLPRPSLTALFLSPLERDEELLSWDPSVPSFDRHTRKVCLVAVLPTAGGCVQLASSSASRGSSGSSMLRVAGGPWDKCPLPSLSSQRPLSSNRGRVEVLECVEFGGLQRLLAWSKVSANSPSKLARRASAPPEPPLW